MTAETQQQLSLFNMNKPYNTDKFYFIAKASEFVNDSYLLWEHNSFNKNIPVDVYVRELSEDIDLSIMLAIQILHSMNLQLSVIDDIIEFDMMSTFVTFGKHSGDSIDKLYKDNIGYLIWLSKNYRLCKLSEEDKLCLPSVFANLRIHFEDMKTNNSETCESEYVGIEGEKLKNLKLTVVSSKLMKGDKYSKDWKIYVCAEDEHQNRFDMAFTEGSKMYKTYGSGQNVISAYSVGDELNIMLAKVKKHYENLGRKTTQLGFVILQENVGF